jgi:hypothetical protein
MYLTIPEIVESEEMLSVSPDADGVTFGVVIGVGDTSVRLMRAHDSGEHLPLVVLTTDAQTLALDSVYVTGVSVVAEPPGAYVSFLAREVRVF